MEDHVEKLKDMLTSTGFVEIVSHKVVGNSIRLLCRVSDKARWRDMLERILLAQKGWTEHLCQQYFLRGKKLVYGWNFVVTSEDLPGAVDSICKAAESIAPAEESGSGYIDEIPLQGAFRPSGPTSFDPRAPGPAKGGASHRGAFSIGGE